MTADNGYFLYYDKSYFTEDDVKTMDRILEVAEAAGKRVLNGTYIRLVSVFILWRYRHGFWH